MCRLDARITILILAMVPMNYAITICLSRRLRTLHETSRKIEERVTTFTSETIEGATISRLFALGHMRRCKLKQLLRDHLDVTFAAWRAATFWGQLGGLAGLTWGMLLLCGGWYLVFIDRLQLGQAVALSMYVSVLARPFQEVGRLYQSIIQDSVAARRVLEILNARRPGLQEGTVSVLARPPRRFELRGMSFAYQEGRPCLHGLDLHLDGGKTVAVIGPSGAGKSTLIRILSGLDDRYQGQFLVDGQDFRSVSRDSYLRHVSLVPQSTFFFSDTIRDNLCAGNGSILSETLQRYADILGVEELIASAPQGYDTKLGSEGIRLSAGQYQKLAVMRAILKDASLLLLDEMTSSMDIESERRLLKGIVALRPPGCATLLVTHHIAVTAEPWIDEVVVMVNGRIAERGSCSQLRDRRGFYHHWLTLNQGVPLDHAVLAVEPSGHECGDRAGP
jgi:ABC-type multidrug transport system fused ATPase/permease subunit